MNISEISLNNIDEFMAFVARFGVKYQNDFTSILSDYPDDFQSIDSTLAKVRSLYRIHSYEKEVLLRPIYFMDRGGDCDNQAAFLISYFLYRGVSVENIYLKLSETAETYHLQMGIKVHMNTLHIYDVLPKEDYEIWAKVHFNSKVIPITALL